MELACFQPLIAINSALLRSLVPSLVGHPYLLARGLSSSFFVPGVLVAIFVIVPSSFILHFSFFILKQLPHCLPLVIGIPVQFLNEP